MKIGIFGDSFATGSSNFKKFFMGSGQVYENPTLDWTEIIGSKYLVTNFARAGSSLMFSVKEFLRWHHDFDKIIFVITNQGRITLNDRLDKTDVKGDCVLPNYRHITGLDDVEFKLKENFLNYSYSDAHIIKKAFQAVKQYYFFIHDLDNDCYLQSLMIDDIKKKRPDTIIIPAFNTSFGMEKKINSMNDIMCKENDHWRIDESNIKYFSREHYLDTRHCHLTFENNCIFAEKVLQWLNGTPFSINLDDFVTPQEPITKYFFPIK